MANRATPQPLPVPPEEISAQRSSSLPDWREPFAAPETLESRLQELADSILLLARGDGVAIALSENGEMRCRANSGHIAPPAGARIDAHSGLTGACVSSGTLLRCNETEVDSRVDREVCRALGIRAMVCVPVTRNQKVVGIFEIFSSRPQAFLKSDLAALRAKAEEIASCFAPEQASTITPAGVADSCPEVGLEVGLGQAWRPVEAQARRWWQGQWISPRTWRAVLGALGFVFGLFLLLRALRGPAPAATASTPPQPVSAPAMSVEVPASPVTRTAERQRVPPRGRPSPARTETADSSFQAAPLTVAADGTHRRVLETPQPTPPKDVLATDASDSALEQLVSSVPAASPALIKNVRVSTGVVQPILVHRVDPVYPAEAKQAGISGRVVLSAVVNKTGRVDVIRVVSGNSLLVPAAVSAIRQWRYQPYELNGIPINVGMNITLNFQLTK